MNKIIDRIDRAGWTVDNTICGIVRGVAQWRRDLIAAHHYTANHRQTRGGLFIRAFEVSIAG